MGQLTHTTGFRSALAAVVLTLTLTACASGEAASPGSASPSPVAPTATPSALPTPTPTTTTPGADAAMPETLFSIDCDDLITSAQLADLFAEPVEPAAVVGAQTGTSRGPLSFATRSVGGVACEWNNGELALQTEDRFGSYSENPDYVGLRIEALPGAAEDWAYYTDVYPEQEPLSCGIAPTGQNNAGFCLSDVLVDDVWIHGVITGVSGDATPEELHNQLQPVFEEMAATIVASRTAEGPVGAVPSEIVLDGTCEQFLPGEAIQGLFGTATATTWVRPHGGWSFDASTFTAVDAIPCLMGAATADVSVGHLTWLPAGSWAAKLWAPAGEPVAITGLTGEDSANLACVGEASCELELVIGGNWIRVETYSEDAAGAEFVPTIDLRTATTAVAEQIVVNLRS